MTFDDWYKIYPRKAAPPIARKAWDKLSTEEQEECYEVTVTRLEKDAAWVEARETGIKKHIPHPSTFLNQQRWLDDYDEVTAVPKKTVWQMTDNELIKTCQDRGITTQGKDRFQLIARLEGKVASI